MFGSIGIDTTKVQNGELPLTVTRPAAQARGAVIVVQEAFGITDHIVDVTRRLATAGYLAIAPHLFHRIGDPALSYDDMGAVREAMDTLTAESLAADIDSCLGYLEQAGFRAKQIGVVGFCMGGSVTLQTAATHALGAAVTFYGGGVRTGRFGWPPLLDYGKTLSTPWLGLFGALDQGIPLDEVEELRTEAAKAPVPSEVVVYAGATHGFHCDARPAAYHPEVAANAWSRTLDWFATYLAA